MAKKFKKGLAAFLAALMCMSTVSMTAIAQEETIWNGNEVSVDVTAGEDAYTFMTVFQAPHHA